MATSQPNPAQSCSSLFSIYPETFFSCHCHCHYLSTITSCLDYCSCFRVGLLVSVPDHLLSLFPPSSQRDLSLPLVRWQLSLVHTLPECANLILSLPHWAPSSVSLLPTPPSLLLLLQPSCDLLAAPWMYKACSHPGTFALAFPSA